MSAGEDEAAVLLRLIRERRTEQIDGLAQGNISSENVANGYRYVTGVIRGLDVAEELIRDVFRGWLPQAPPGQQHQSAKRPMGDY